MKTDIRIGTAGWAIPAQSRDAFPESGTTIERYAARFNAAEINSSFHRPHRPATYERWAASVPEGFRFAVKLPKTITHKAKLADSDPLLAQFATEIAGLGEKRGPMLIQLPPSLAFNAGLARAFLAALAEHLPGSAVCEPRHPSWFDPEADALLAAHHIARVAADPAPVPAAGSPGGWPGLAYFRLHGSPDMYWQKYGPERVAEWAGRIAPFAARTETWAMFDNTAGGGAAGDALLLGDRLAGN